MKTLGIPFIHKRAARSRSVKIHIDPDGNVVVTTPIRFPTRELPRFVEEARDWIEKRQIELKSKPRLISEAHVYFFGVKHELIIDDAMDGSVIISEGKITISPLTGSARASLEKWLKNRAIEYCLSRLEIISAQMKVTYNGVRFKQQRTCWGSCSSDKNLNFNWKLIHAPKDVIDYVIIHELAHTVHLNHSRAFWDLVARFDPDHPLHRGWLRRYGNTTE